jgi:hypothetical protein
VSSRSRIVMLAMKHFVMKSMQSLQRTKATAKAG